MASALALLSQGANGNTLEELKNGLHLSGDKSDVADQYLGYYSLLQKGAGNVTLSIANQLFVNEEYQLNKNFQEIAVQKFNSGVESMDFSNASESTQLINDFVEKKTEGKITDLIKPESLDENSRIVLVNAIYMKAKWQFAFEKSDTYKEDFYLNETEIASVDFMHIVEAFNFVDLPDLDASALEMKYIDSELSFVVVLPNNRTGLSTLEGELQDYALSNITEQMRIRFIDVSFPQFKIESQIKLSDILKEV